MLVVFPRTFSYFKLDLLALARSHAFPESNFVITRKRPSFAEYALLATLHAAMTRLHRRKEGPSRNRVMAP